MPLTGACAAGLGGCVTTASTPMTTSSPTGFSAQSSTVQVAFSATTRYGLVMPKAVAANPAQRWPLLMFLHGSGERGTDLNLVKAHGPWAWLAQQADTPFIVVAPQADVAGGWNPHVLQALIEKLKATLPVDPDRVLVTGLSMGGFGAWALAIEYPDTLAAIAPICGFGDEDRVERIRHLPVWAFHGTDDPVVPIAGHRAAIAALRQAGGAPRFTEYPGVDHDSWTVTYNNPSLYEWLLAQRRSPATR
jgi:predicted peptidase